VIESIADLLDEIQAVGYQSRCTDPSHVESSNARGTSNHFVTACKKRLVLVDVVVVNETVNNSMNITHVTSMQ
jgi:hypothetical protein